MLKFKPEARKTWDDSKDSIIKYIKGEIEEVIINDSIAFGIEDTDECNNFIQQALDHDGDYIALDSETTGLYPRDGYMSAYHFVTMVNEGLILAQKRLTKLQKNCL